MRTSSEPPRGLAVRALLTICMLVVALAGCDHGQPLQAVSAKEVGLVWKECALNGTYSDWGQVGGCFGHAMPLWTEVDMDRYAERVGLDTFRLTIGDDVYHTDVRPYLVLLGQEKYTLYRNGEAVAVLRGEFTAHSPSISLQSMNGVAVWEFADGTRATIIYDGQDIRKLYGLDRAYAPYSIDGKLIFIGEKDGVYFVVYDGARIGPDFDDVTIAYCCEIMLYSVHYGQGRYLFSGARGGQHYLVEISARPQ